MTATTERVSTPTRDAWVMVGMAVAAASAATASFTGLRGLASVAGWPDRLAWLLPITIDAYAMTSARVWLAGTSHTRSARRFARANAVGAIAASIVGNAAYHMVSAGLISVSWPIVVLVGAVPAAVLGLTAHLHALRTLDRDPPTGTAGRAGPGTNAESGPEDTTRDGTEKGIQSGTEDGTRDGTTERTESGTATRTRTRPRRRTKTRTEDALMAAARAADARYRATHDGRPITRDALRTALRIAGPRATELRRRLAAEQNPEQSAEQTQPPSPEPATGQATDRTEDPDRKEAHTTR